MRRRLATVGFVVLAVGMAGGVWRVETNAKVASRRNCESVNDVALAVRGLAEDLGADGPALKAVERRFPIRDC